MEYDRVHLTPRQVSTINSRSEIDTSVVLFGHERLKVPIIASPMKDVCDFKVARKMCELGGLGILHRFCTVNEQCSSYNIVREGGGICACAIGLEEQRRFLMLYDRGCRYFCIDVANGANLNVREAIKNYLKLYVNCTAKFIVGNVASQECAQWCADLPHVHAIRVGIAGGTACTTRSATGIYSPPISCLRECSTIEQDDIAIIADGGIREPSHYCKALALGCADMVMVGSIIAQTADSPAEVVVIEGVAKKLFHGSASFEVQQQYKDTPRYIEGAKRFLPFTGESLESLIGRFQDGLKSSMSYFDARNLTEYRTNVVKYEIPF